MAKKPRQSAPEQAPTARSPRPFMGFASHSQGPLFHRSAPSNKMCLSRATRRRVRQVLNVRPRVDQNNSPRAAHSISVTRPREVPRWASDLSKVTYVMLMSCSPPAAKNAACTLDRCVSAVRISST